MDNIDREALIKRLAQERELAAANRRAAERVRRGGGAGSATGALHFQHHAEAYEAEVARLEALLRDSPPLPR